MNEQLAQTLTQLTSEFYAEVHESFAETRTSAWCGWERLLTEVRPQLSEHHTVLDLACGNLRFERFLAEADLTPETYAYDNCDPLVGEAPGHIHYQHLDLTRFPLSLACPQAHLAVSFGFLHHLPQPEQRLQLLQALASHTVPGGHIAVSFWQFARSEKLRVRAERTTAEARQALHLPELPENDYLLGWQHAQGAWRYAHSFTESEITSLAEALAPQATEVARFSADGKTNDLNRYLVLRKR